MNNNKNPNSGGEEVRPRVGWLMVVAIVLGMVGTQVWRRPDQIGGRMMDKLTSRIRIFVTVMVLLVLSGGIGLCQPSSQATVLALGGQKTTHNNGTTKSRSNAASVVRQKDFRYYETIEYTWDGYRIIVEFTKGDGDAAWDMEVRDAYSIYDQRKEDKVWDISASLCSKEECVRIIERSLLDFHKRRPHSQLRGVFVENQVVRDLWGEILTGLSKKLPTLEGTVPCDLAETPIETSYEVGRILDRSSTMRAIRTLLARRGMKVRIAGSCNQITFKRTYAGQKWSQIAKLPGVGIDLPGRFEIARGER